MKDEKSQISGGRIFLRILAVVFLPLIAAIVLGAIFTFIEDWGRRAGLIYMRYESLLLIFLPFAGAVLAALIAKWTVSKKAALRIFTIAVVGAIAFLGKEGLLETISTRPIVAAAGSFKELPGLTREMGNNGDMFSPAPGFIPCVDIMGNGCPNIRRTWIAEPDRKLTVQDLQKVLDYSGWKDVKIKPEDCDTAERDFNNYPRCTAEGMVGNYKATVEIIKIQNWELRLYLRLPTAAR